MDITAVTSIGGKGTRLKDISKGLPKALIKINGKTVLFRIAEQLSNCGIKSLFVLKGYKSEMFNKEINLIEKNLDVKVFHYLEESPLGECGAIWDIQDKIKSKDILFICGDIVFDMDLKKFVNFHKRLKSKFSLVSHITSHPEDSDLIRAPNGVQITDFSFKNNSTKQNFKGYLGNAGISLFSKEILLEIKRNKSKENTTVFKNLAYEYFKNSGRIFSYNTSEYIKDMGTPSRLEKVSSDEKINLIKKLSYKNKQKCLFIDRDDTLIHCKEGEYILDESEVHIKLNKIKELVAIRNKFDLCIMVTNQPQISMGLLSIDNLYDINCKVILQLFKKGFKIDDISFCPHHNHSGFKGELKELKLDCFCRKPNPGMFMQQSFLKNIDLKNSLLIGDSEVDKLSAKNSGMKFININSL
jgi:histidinol-phosphate phosphatase family protein